MKNTITSINPSNNYSTIWEVEITTLDEIREKIRISKIAQIKWWNLDIDARVNYLKELIVL